MNAMTRTVLTSVASGLIAFVAAVYVADARANRESLPANADVQVMIDLNRRSVIDPRFDDVSKSVNFLTTAAAKAPYASYDASQRFALCAEVATETYRTDVQVRNIDRARADALLKDAWLKCGDENRRFLSEQLAQR